MADWFKFFENDLDETRLQYAISKLPEVVSVWVGILSEACRHKSDTIRWGSNEIEMFGFSRRLGISIPKVNEAVNLLQDIDYIQKGENLLKVIKWNNKQSEYCQKKAKESALKTDSVPTVSRQCPESVGLEERRGEEIRGDKRNGAEALASMERFKSPSIEEAKSHGVSMSPPLNPEECEKFWNYYESNGWRVGKNPMKSWKSSMVLWRSNSQKHYATSKSNPPQRVDRSIGTLNEGTAANYAGIKSAGMGDISKF